MTVAPRAASFLDNLRASALLSAAQLADLAKCPEARNPAPTPLARVVLQRGWLTRFQLNTVAAGRAKDLVVGPYVLLDKLGEGGMGMVYKARHQHMQRVVALKVIRKEKLANPESVKRFYQEVQLAGQLSHPNIVLAYDAAPAGNTHYFAMEYVEGVDLARLVKEQGRLPLPQACDYVRQAALGLQHAHEKGLIHRDIKPHNLLVSRAPAAPDGAPAPRGDVVKLLDMGLARLQGAGDTGMTKIGAVIGTPDYLAPEQAMNSKAADIRADLYSLGCTLYYLLTGKPPFVGGELTELLLKHQMEKPPTLAEQGVQAPREVQAILDKLMAKHPDDRYQTPAELVEALTPFCREGTLASGALQRAREADSSGDNVWGSLTLGVETERGRAGRSAAVDRTIEAPRRGGKRLAAEESAAEAPNRILRAVGIVGAVAVLAIGLLCGGLYWVFWRAPSAPQVAEKPVATESVRKEPVVGTERIAPPPRGAPDAVPDGGRPAPPPDGGGKPAEKPLPDGPRPGDRVLKGPGKFIPAPGSESTVALALSPDGKRLALGAGMLSLWDVEAGRVIGDGARSHGHVRSLAWSDDGRKLLVGGDAGKALLVDGETGRVEREFAGHTSDVHAVAFSPDGRQAMTAGGKLRFDGGQAVKGPDGKPVFDDLDIRRWDVATGTEVGRYGGFSCPVQAITFSADGRHVWADSVQFEGPGLYDWDADKAGAPRRVPQPSAIAAAFSPDRRELALLATDRAVHVYDLDTAAEVRRSDALPQAIRVGWARDGSHIACGTHADDNHPKGAVYLLSSATCKEVKRFTVERSIVWALDVSPRGRSTFVSLAPRGIWLLDRDQPDAADVPIRPGPIAEAPLPAPVGPSLTLQLPDQAKVISAAFAPDGKHIALGTFPNKLLLWDLQLNKEVPAFRGPTEFFIRVLTWSADSSRILFGTQEGAGGRAHVLDAVTGKVVKSFAGHPNPITAVALSRDGRRALTAAGHVRLADGKPVKGPDGRTLWDDTEVRLWDTATGKLLGSYRGPTEPMKSLAFATDGTTFFGSGSQSGRSPVFAWQEGNEEGRRVTLPADAERHGAAVSPDGREVVTGGDDGCWHIYDLMTGKEVRSSLRLAQSFHNLTWSRDGRFIACVAVLRKDGPAAKPGFVICLTDATTGRVERVFDMQSSQMTSSIALSDDGARAYATTPAAALVWNRDPVALPVKPDPVKPDPVKPAPVAEKPTFTGHDGAVTCVAFSADGKLLLSGGKDQTVRLWDVGSGTEMKSLRWPGTAPAQVAFAGRGKQVVATSLTQGFMAWELETGTVAHQMNFGNHSADAISPDGDWVLLALGKNFIQIHKATEAGGRPRQLRGKWETVAIVAFAPDGRSVVFVGGDGLIHVGDVRAENEVGKGFQGPKTEVNCLAVAPKGTYLLTAAEDKSVTLWKLPTPQVPTLQALHSFRGHKDKVHCLAFSADGKHIVTGGADATVRVWDLTGKQLALSSEHKEPVRGVAFSPDGKSVVSCGDGIRLWDWQQKPPAKP
jgi:WD40 repeat protein/serine/threonine protein kinase